MEKICIGKGIVIGIIQYLDYFDAKQDKNLILVINLFFITIMDASSFNPKIQINKD